MGERWAGFSPRLSKLSPANLSLLIFRHTTLHRLKELARLVSRNSMRRLCPLKRLLLARRVDRPIRMERPRQMMSPLRRRFDPSPPPTRAQPRYANTPFVGTATLPRGRVPPPPKTPGPTSDRSNVNTTLPR